MVGAGGGSIRTFAPSSRVDTGSAQPEERRHVPEFFLPARHLLHAGIPTPHPGEMTAAMEKKSRLNLRSTSHYLFERMVLLSC